MKKFATHELLIKLSAQIQVNISSSRAGVTQYVLNKLALWFFSIFFHAKCNIYCRYCRKYERRYKSWCLEQIKEISNIWKKPSVIVKNKITLQQKNWGWGKSNNNLLPKFSLNPPTLSITLYFYCKLDAKEYWKKFVKNSGEQFALFVHNVYGPQ